VAYRNDNDDCCDVKEAGGCNTDDCCASNNDCCSSPSCIPVTKAPCCIANNNKCCSSSNNLALTAAAATVDEQDKQQHLTCIAVIRPDNMTVDVFDVNGRSRAFRSKNKALNNKLLSSKLCFSTHGAAGDNIDGMLTYCFNGKGEHGEPDDEVCPCGEEEPHLHAHIHNPEVCSSGSENDNKGRICNVAKQHANNNWRFLSQLTLHLVEDDNSDDDNPPNDGLANLPINSSMPKQCNAEALQQHLSDNGLQIPRRECCNSEEKKNECDKHRKFPVRHEDHTDYLVHNEASGQLHMEHPCVSCGDNDIHGRFRLLHTRSWVGDETSYQNRGKEKAREIRLHFFEAHPEPFHLLDVFSGLFELESSRVHAVRPVEVMERRPSSASTVELSPQRGKSQFFVEKICCAAEANQIKSLLKKNGISDVNISTTTKTVYVEHDFDLISANDVASILNAERFGAHVKKDAALQAASKIGIPTDAYVYSTFGLSKALEGANAAKRSLSMKRSKILMQMCRNKHCPLHIGHTFLLRQASSMSWIATCTK
jgi:copper chaperone CopZ